MIETDSLKRGDVHEQASSLINAHTLRTLNRKGLKGLMKRLGCKGLTKGSKGSSPRTRAMAHKWLSWFMSRRLSFFDQSCFARNQG